MEMGLINKLSECHLAGLKQACSLRAELTGCTQHRQVTPEGNGFSYETDRLKRGSFLVVIRLNMVVPGFLLDVWLFVW